jgi:hypothetical protein
MHDSKINRNNSARLLLMPLPVLLLAGALGCAGTADSMGGNGDGSGPNGASYDGGVPFDACAAVTEVAKNTYQPVDIVFVIDNTQSMIDELDAVRANMNAFSQSITSSGLDAHIVLISILPWDCDDLQTKSCYGICIEPPLGAADACSSEIDDSNPPSYLHISTRVQSTKTLSNITSTYGTWKSMIRADSKRHFVLVSDDTDEMSAEQFNTQLLALDPGFEGYQFHGIFSFMSKSPACAAGHPCCDYAAPDGEGVPYKNLVAMTSGVSSDLCQQSFDPVMQEIATSVVKGVRLNCSWPIPDPPQGKDLEPNLVNVEFVDGSGTSSRFGRVDTAEMCDKVDHAWYYDSVSKPTTILVCPQTCDWLQGKAGSEIRISFGCKTELAPIE